MNPFFSLIIPVYNVEAYLEKCLDSILDQTFSLFEVICINDGSDDASGEICSIYQSKDARVKLINQTNQGVSIARNKGIDCVEGEYIVFIDSDDWIDHDFLENLYFHLIDFNPDILFHGFYEEFLSKRNSVLFDEMAGFYQSPGEAIFLLEKIHRFGYVWCKVFKTSIVREFKLCFNELISFREDEIFTLDYCLYVSNVLIIKGAKYHYRCGNPGSLVNKVHSYDELQYSANLLCNKSYEIAEKFALPLFSKFIRKKLDIPYHTDALLILYNEGSKMNKKDRLTALRLYHNVYKNDSFLLGLRIKHYILILFLNIGGVKLTDKLLSLYYLYFKK